jgi:DNA-directed RNA polymerase subunit D
MEIRLLEQSKNKDKLSFMLNKSTPAYANTIRRLIINRVPTLAMENIEIRKNNSALYDEILAHRLGLITLKTDLKTYVEKENCKCNNEGCAQCEVKLTLKAKGPGIIKASQLKSQDPKVIPVFPDTPIVKLQKEQEVEIIATAILGNGKTHSKWSPGHVWYTYKPNITINNKSSKLEEYKNNYPKKIFNNGLIDKNLINTPALIDACEGVCDDIIKIEYENNSFIFYIESFGQLNVKEMINNAIEKFDNLIDEFNNKLSKI